MNNHILLEKEQEELLCRLVEAHNNVPKERKQKFFLTRVLFDRQQLLTHEGLEGGRQFVYGGDVEALARANLLAATDHKTTTSFDITPLGFRYYREIGGDTPETLRTAEAETRASPRRKRFVITFLGHRAWAGIAGLVTIASLLVSVFSGEEKQSPRSDSSPTSGRNVLESDQPPSPVGKLESQFRRKNETSERDSWRSSRESPSITILDNVGEGAVVYGGDVFRLIVNRNGDIINFSELPEEVVQTLQNEFQVTEQALEDIYTELERQNLSRQEFEAELREFVATKRTEQKRSSNHPYENHSEVALQEQTYEGKEDLQEFSVSMGADLNRGQ